MRKETTVIPLSLRKQNKNYYVEITKKCGTFISTFSNKNKMFYYNISRQRTAQSETGLFKGMGECVQALDS